MSRLGMWPEDSDDWSTDGVNADNAPAIAAVCDEVDRWLVDSTSVPPWLVAAIEAD